MSTAHILRPLLLLAASAGHLAAADPLVERIPAVFERAATQYSGMLEAVSEQPGQPRTTKPDGSVHMVPPEDWTSGFFPGCLWFLHEYDGSD